MANKEALMLFEYQKKGELGGRVVINVDRGMVQAKICVFEFSGDDKNCVCGKLADTLNDAIAAALEAI